MRRGVELAAPAISGSHRTSAVLPAGTGGLGLDLWFISGPADLDGSDGALTKTPITAQGGATLSAVGVYTVVKRFMGRAAKSAADTGLDAQRFGTASTHWMRHTLVCQTLVDGAPIEVVSELAGHVSIATTSICSSQELARKVEAIRGEAA